LLTALPDSRWSCHLLVAEYLRQYANIEELKSNFSIWMLSRIATVNLRLLSKLTWRQKIQRWVVSFLLSGGDPLAELEAERGALGHWLNTW